TRLAAASPRPEKASAAGSRGVLSEYSPGPSLPCPAPPDGGAPSFLDSNPSDPMTPDPTHRLQPVSLRRYLKARCCTTAHEQRTRISNQKITLPLASHR